MESDKCGAGFGFATYKLSAGSWFKNSELFHRGVRKVKGDAGDGFQFLSISYPQACGLPHSFFIHNFMEY